MKLTQAISRKKTLIFWGLLIFVVYCMVFTLLSKAQDIPDQCLPGKHKECKKSCDENGGNCVLACSCVDDERLLAQLAPAKDVTAERSWQKPSPAVMAKGTQPSVDPVVAPRALPVLDIPLGDVARRNRTMHPMTIDVQDFRLVCRDWTPGETCIIENKPAPKTELYDTK